MLNDPAVAQAINPLGHESFSLQTKCNLEASYKLDQCSLHFRQAIQPDDIPRFAYVFRFHHGEIRLEFFDATVRKQRRQMESTLALSLRR